ncbi:MAG: hypothetical protein PSV13_19510 [Lacunisphaera sp.]|nr:hypothetical protein [Lacunisphaera sp.]
MARCPALTHPAPPPASHKIELPPLLSTPLSLSAPSALSQRSPWLLVVGLDGHGVFDFFHGHVITNPGVPPWWPAFCGAYDVTAAVHLAWLLLRPGAAGQK